MVKLLEYIFLDFFRKNNSQPNTGKEILKEKKPRIFISVTLLTWS